MKRVGCIFLNERDVKEIIAEKYGVDTCDVKVDISFSDPQYPVNELSVQVFIEQLKCGYGGIGIHTRLKIQQSNDYEGSSPSCRT